MPFMSQAEKSAHDFSSGVIPKTVSEAEAYNSYVNGQGITVVTGQFMHVYRFDSSITSTVTTLGAIKVDTGGSLILASGNVPSITKADIDIMATDGNNISQICYASDLNELYLITNSATPVKIDSAVPVGATWGSITGTLSDQTDLIAALDLKAPIASPVFTTEITTPTVKGTADLALTTTANGELNITPDGTGKVRVYSSSTVGQVLKATTTTGVAEWGDEGAVWGQITGNIPNQIDLQAALDLKAPKLNASLTGTTKIITPVVPTVGQVLKAKSVDGELEWKDEVGGGGDVSVFGAPVIDTALSTFSGTTGKTIQASPVTVSGIGEIANVRDITMSAGGVSLVDPSNVANQWGSITASSISGLELSGTPGVLIDASLDLNLNPINNATVPDVTLGSSDSKIANTKYVDDSISASGGGDVRGPATSVDEEIAVYSGTTGKILKTTPVKIDGAGAITNIDDLSMIGVLSIGVPATASSISLDAVGELSVASSTKIILDSPLTDFNLGNLDRIGKATITALTLDGIIDDVPPVPSVGSYGSLTIDSDDGLVVRGKGINNDVTIKNDLGQTVLKVPLGTQNVVVEGLVIGDTLTVVPGTSDGSLASTKYVDDAISASGGGDVTGAASSTANAITRFDGATGKILKNSTVALDDTGEFTGATVPNVTAGDSSTKIANTNYVDNAVSGAGHGDVSQTGGAVTADSISVFDGTTGKIIKESAVTVTGNTITNGALALRGDGIVPSLVNGAIYTTPGVGINMVGNGTVVDFQISGTNGNTLIYVQSGSGTVNINDLLVDTNIAGQTTLEPRGANTGVLASTAFVQQEIADLLTMRNNIGHIKILSKGGNKPSGNLVQNTPVQVQYGAGTLDLATSPTTHFPLSNTAKLDSSIYDSTNNSWLENTFTLGQVTVFRIEVSYTGIAGTGDTQIRLRLHNTNTASSFDTTHSELLNENATSGRFSVDITTISDSASIPLPLGTTAAHGYNLEIDTNRTNGTWQLEAVTIISQSTSFI